MRSSNIHIEIRQITPELVNEYLSFFDEVVFEENPDWSICYCYSFHFTGRAEEWTRENNRSAVVKLVTEKKMKGYLAFHNDQIVGWCNANERKAYQSLTKHYELTDLDNDRVCSIVCFLISPKYRRQGIAEQLLQKVSYDYENTEYDFLEAYPAKGALSCEGHYHGHLELYEKLGFTITKEFDTYFVVRKSLIKK